jgi:Ca2+-dependent lipid-binding protein
MLFFTTICVSLVVLTAGQKHKTQSQQAPINPNQFNQDVNLTFVVSARDLPSADIIGKVDPYVKLYSSSKEKPEPEKFSTSEVVVDDPNPEFTQVFWFVWKKGTEQKWSLKFRDQDNLRPDNPLGEVTVDVDQYVANREKLNVTLDTNATVLIQKTTPLKIRLYARNLPSKDTIGKSDPFVNLYWRRGAKGDDIKFAQTSVIENEENPDWNDVIEFPNYIKGTDQWWSFQVRDHDGIGSDDDLGETLVEIDPYALKRATKIVKLGKDGKSTLAITPV